MDNINKVIIDGQVKYTRICPKCKSVVFYTLRGNASVANKERRSCNKCKVKYTKEGIEKARQKRKDSGYAVWKTPEFLEKMRKISTENNPMKGRSVYSVWLKKYGKEEADKRMELMKEKRRIQMSGKNNHMYGKPSPQGSGNGWKGWYKNVYFRSLRELMILIDLIDNNKPYISLEKREYAVQYIDYNGQTRNYFGDYLIDNQWVEIKPVRLQSTIENKAKREAAEKVCSERGWTFKYIDPVIDSELIKVKYLNGNIKWAERYKEKVDKFYQLNQPTT